MADVEEQNRNKSGGENHMHGVEGTVAPSSDWSQGSGSYGHQRDDSCNAAQHIRLFEFASQKVILNVEVEIESCVQDHQERHDPAQQLVIGIERLV